MSPCSLPNMPEPVHIPVMLDEVLHWLAPQPGSVFVDGTLGGGGHTRALAERVEKDGTVVALDRDPTAISAAETNLQGLPVKVANASYHELPEILRQIGVPRVDGILLDLGLSSDQLADRTRGFSFQSDGELDLRFDPTEGKPAWHILKYWTEKQIADAIYKFGEERFSRRIARRVVEVRKTTELISARQLTELVEACVPKSRDRDRIHPATRTFQALRIVVNDELGILDKALKIFPDFLKIGGKLAVISFHSLEDRPVKTIFRDDERYQVLTRRPIRPSEEEVHRNPRSRSARLRVAQRAGVKGSGVNCRNELSDT